jgi:hypothetical protein
MPEEKVLNGKFLGSGQLSFLKDVIDLADIRGFAVLIQRVTPSDKPDKEAYYNAYQIDFNMAKSSPGLTEEIKNLVDYILNRYISHPSSQLRNDLTAKARMLLKNVGGQ